MEKVLSNYVCTTDIEGVLTKGNEYQGYRNEHNQLVVKCDDKIERVVRSMYFRGD